MQPVLVMVEHFQEQGCLAIISTVLKKLVATAHT